MRTVIGLLLLGFVSLTAGCRSMSSATRGEKAESMKTYGEKWEPDGTVRRFALQRSVQMLDPNGFRNGAYNGDVGMASVISPDGYALTAAHVVNDPPLTAFYVATNDKGVAVAVSHTAVFRLKSKDGKQFLEMTVPFRYGKRGPQPVGEKNRVLRQARVVKVFPRHDLALLKLPVENFPFLILPEVLPERGAVLFTPGNLMGFTPEPAAGVLSWTLKGSEGRRTLFTSVPLAPGDSGGPILNASGELVGVGSRAWPHRWFPFLPTSEMAALEKAEIEGVIAADRRQSAR